MFIKEKILRTRQSKFGPKIKDLANNGTLSMLTNGREIQRRVNSTNTSVFMLKDHSILSPD
jgi:hypothetical protein